MILYLFTGGIIVKLYTPREQSNSHTRNIFLRSFSPIHARWPEVRCISYELLGFVVFTFSRSSLTDTGALFE
jgi:hypothetical protein